MNAMSLAGRRGEVRSKKGICYDAFVVNFGLMVPFSLGDLVHVWDIPVTRFGGPAKGLRLRTDPAFKRRALLVNWAGMSALGMWIGTPFLWGYVHFALGIAGLITASALTIVTIMLAGGEGSRHRQIRVVLGRHTWGHSDPATWHKSIKQHVQEPQTFGADSFAKLAIRAMKKGEWSKAMWAARLCALAENQDRGEELTDEILDQDEVRSSLPHVTRNPHDHNEEFGKPPPLKQWLDCDPREHIIDVD